MRWVGWGGATGRWRKVAKKRKRVQSCITANVSQTTTEIRRRRFSRRMLSTSLLTAALCQIANREPSMMQVTIAEIKA